MFRSGTIHRAPPAPFTQTHSISKIPVAARFIVPPLHHFLITFCFLKPNIGTPLERIQPPIKFFQSNILKTIRQCCPAFLSNIAVLVKQHFPVGEGPEKTSSFVRAYRNEVCSRLGIIVSLQTKGSTVINGRIGFYIQCFCIIVEIMMYNKQNIVFLFFKEGAQ